MNKDLANYIVNLPDEVSLRIWLKIYAKSKRNGNAVVIFRDLILDHRLTDDQLDQCFNPEEAEKLELIRIITQTDNFIVINFKAKDKPVNLKKVIKATTTVVPTEHQKHKAAGKAETSLLVTNSLPEAFDATGLLKQLPANYQITHTLRKAIIVDYTLFFKGLQINKATLAGITPDMESKLLKPYLKEKEVSQLQKLAMHFKNIGCTSEAAIQKSFIKIYMNWHLLDDYTQRMSSPGGILTNINSIVLQITKLSNNVSGKTNKEQKREAELSDKIQSARGKDYSKLVQKG